MQRCGDLACMLAVYLAAASYETCTDDAGKRPELKVACKAAYKRTFKAGRKDRKPTASWWIEGSSDCCPWMQKRT